MSGLSNLSLDFGVSHTFGKLVLVDVKGLLLENFSVTYGHNLVKFSLKK